MSDIPLSREQWFNFGFVILQGQTMQMMYEIVAQELKAMDLDDSHPNDYLNFYCLGNREECPEENSHSTSQPSSNGDGVMMQTQLIFH